MIEPHRQSYKRTAHYAGFADRAEMLDELSGSTGEGQLDQNDCQGEMQLVLKYCKRSRGGPTAASAPSKALPYTHSFPSQPNSADPMLAEPLLARSQPVLDGDGGGDFGGNEDGMTDDTSRTSDEYRLLSSREVPEACGSPYAAFNTSLNTSYAHTSMSYPMYGLKTRTELTRCESELEAEPELLPKSAFPFVDNPSSSGGMEEPMVTRPQTEHFSQTAPSVPESRPYLIDTGMYSCLSVVHRQVDVPI